MARRVTFATIAQPQTEPLQGAAELTDGQKRYVETVNHLEEKYGRKGKTRKSKGKGKGNPLASVALTNKTMLRSIFFQTTVG